MKKTKKKSWLVVRDSIIGVGSYPFIVTSISDCWKRTSYGWADCQTLAWPVVDCAFSLLFHPWSSFLFSTYLSVKEALCWEYWKISTILEHLEGWCLQIHAYAFIHFQGPFWRQQNTTRLATERMSVCEDKGMGFPLEYADVVSIESSHIDSSVVKERMLPEVSQRPRSNEAKVSQYSQSSLSIWKRVLIAPKEEHFTSPERILLWHNVGIPTSWLGGWLLHFSEWGKEWRFQHTCSFKEGFHSTTCQKWLFVSGRKELHRSYVLCVFLPDWEGYCRGTKTDLTVQSYGLRLVCDRLYLFTSLLQESFVLLLDEISFFSKILRFLIATVKFNAPRKLNTFSFSISKDLLHP